MSNLEELIERLCPDGVEYKELKNIIKSLNTGLNPRKFFKLNTEDANNYYGRLQVQIEQDLSSNYISGIHLIKKSVEQFIRSVVA